MLRQLRSFHKVYIRQSMEQAESDLDKELRRQARELNDKKNGGKKIYVVYHERDICRYM